MVNGMQFKICGLTRAEDAQAAFEAGADFLGFNFYPKSPRYILLQDYAKLRKDLPSLPKVAIAVAPDSDELAALGQADFDFFQIHFPLDAARRVAAWSEAVGADRLWLAPKMTRGARFEAAWVELASAILWDAAAKDATVFGGTGERSDWAAFRALQAEYSGARWILAGGLSPENAPEAVREAEAKILDFNSGLEISPGIKDHSRIFAVRDVLSRRQ